MAFLAGGGKCEFWPRSETALLVCFIWWCRWGSLGGGIVLHWPGSLGKSWKGQLQPPFLHPAFSYICPHSLFSCSLFIFVPHGPSSSHESNTTFPSCLLLRNLTQELKCSVTIWQQWHLQLQQGGMRMASVGVTTFSRFFISFAKTSVLYEMYTDT